MKIWKSIRALFMSIFGCICREQDEDLDDLGASVVRLGDVGLTIHEELAGQVLLLKNLPLMLIIIVINLH